MKKVRTTLRIDQLQLNEGQLDWLGRNPRKGTQEDIDRTVQSLLEDPDYLEDRPLLVIPAREPEQFVVFCGNLRLTAAGILGWPDLPCVIYTPEKTADPEAGGKPTFREDRATVIRRALKDNGTFGHWDYDELPNWGIPAEQLVSWGVETPEWASNADNYGEGGEGGSGEGGSAQEDDFDENTDEIHVVCKTGDIWELGEHRLMCGDSTDAGTVALLMNGERSDMVFTDPPYGITALKWDVKIDLEKMFDNIWGACKKNACILFTGVQPFVTDLINAGRNFFRHEIIWKKTQSTGFLQANHAPLKIHENILVFCKGNGTYNPKKEVIGEGTGRVRHQSANRAAHYHGNHESTYVDDGTRFPTSVIEFSNWNGALFGNVSNAVLHPTQKPVDLVAYLIETYSNNNDSVLDIFGGSGTTLIASEQLGRRCYMMELDPHYCDVIIARWEKLTGRKAEKIN